MNETTCWCLDPNCDLPPATRKMKFVAWFVTRDRIPMWLRRRVFRWLAFR